MENPREIIDDKYQAFIDNDSIHMNYTKLEYVYKSYIGLLDKIDAVSMLMKERQFLTELHLMGPLFPLTAHEKYHDVSDKLQIEASDFFKGSKIFLNDFTRFYIGEIGKDDNLFLTSQDMFLLRTEHGTHCYVHVSPYYTTGADVFSGDEIGEIYDGTKLHFKKYGAHIHYFPPLNDDLENGFSMPVHIHQIGESPDILHSIDLITIFTFTALDSLMTYKTNQ